MGRIKTQEEILLSFNKTHGKTYKYDNFIYYGYQIKSYITCFWHGDFLQTPDNHICGKGCPKCGEISRGFANSKTVQQFVVQADIKHNYKYNYDKVIYTNDHTKVIITCINHGDFVQTPSSHLQGAGCSKCAGKMVSNTESFIKEANKKHNYKYNYGKFMYINSQTRGTIICKNHGKFYQRPNDHLNGKGCKKCGIESSKLKQKGNALKFIEKANIIHNFKYDYNKFIYINAKTKGIVVCKIKNHGEFLINPNNHLNGKKRPSCAAATSEAEIKWLDWLNIDNQYRQKIIKIGNKKFVVDAYDPNTNTVYEFNGDFWHGNPDMFDPNDINPVCNETFGKLYKKTIDREKMIVDGGYHIVSIWENNWNEIINK